MRKMFSPHHDSDAAGARGTEWAITSPSRQLMEKLLNGALPVEIRMEIYPSSNIMETNWSYAPKTVNTGAVRHTISIKIENDHF